MSRQPSDQRSYSVDEMMERLREGEREKRSQPEQPQLVTRPDGTQVMRVRRRKRRSRQPNAERAKAAMRQRRSTFVLGAFAIALLLAAAVALLLLLAKYNSKGFQEGLESRIEGNLGAEVAIRGLSVTPLKARAGAITLEWGEDRFLESLVLKKLETKVGIFGLLGADWGGEEIVAASGHLKFGQPTSQVPGPAAAGEVKPFEVKQLQCSFCTIEFGDRKESGALIKSCELILRTGKSGERQVLLRGGTLDIAGWPALKVDNGLGRVGGGALDIVFLRAMPKDGSGEIVFRSIDPVQPERPVVLGMKLTKFPLSILAGQGMDAIIGGVVDAPDGSLHLKDGTLGSADIRVEFKGADGSLKSLPFLENLRTAFSDFDYLEPTFLTVRGTYRRGANGTEIQGLELDDPNQMTIRGNIGVSPEGALSGTLRVGIPERKVITTTKRKRYGCFSDPEGGYCWVDIELAGTPKDPQDNFKVLLQQAAEDAFQRKKFKEPGGSRFDELTQ